MKFKLIITLISILAINLCAEETKKLNHLKDEISPYLLQHAENPVDWYPWGEEAFEKARKENKPIFLSIGYSSCHWCHVMEHESFEDEEVAKVLNEKFISVKVDREERPDIDNIYMTACQILGGNCGWPLNLFLNHDLKPFFAGTYFPKESRYGRMGFMDLLERVDDQWNNNRAKIDESAEAIGSAISNDLTNSKSKFDESILDSAYSAFAQQYDTEYGGFGIRPKFPSPHNLTYLLRYYHQSGEKQALDMVTHTLKEMRKGGIFDHIGLGFHRYSTDNLWLLPHFEKMLYDQATLLKAYTEAYQITGDEEFKNTALEIVEYVKRDMTGENGEFYSAEDADSEGVEGKYYVWELDEIQSLLGEDAEKFIEIYNIYKRGNYTEEAAGHGAGGNIPHIDYDPHKVAKVLEIKEEKVREKLNEFREKLFEARLKRIPPFKDKKALTDWNSHFSASLAIAGRAFGDQDLVKMGEKNIQFIENTMVKDDVLKHSYLNGRAQIEAHLDDYAYLSKAYLEMYYATLKPEYLDRSMKYMNIAIDKFWDKEKGGFFFSEEGKDDLIARTKDYYDNAIPSGNSIMLNLLVKFGKLTGNTKYSEMADKMLNGVSDVIRSAPTAFAEMLSAAMLAYKESYEIVIVGDDKLASEMISQINQNYLPNMVLVYRQNDENDDKISEIADYTKQMYMVNGKSTVYVCKNFVCENPTNDIDKMLKYLKVKK